MVEKYICIIHSFTPPKVFDTENYKSFSLLSIDKLGKEGETVRVAPGYFRNHLMLKLLAIPNIDKYRHLMEDQRKIYQREEVEEAKIVPATKEDKLKEYQMSANRLDRTMLVARQIFVHIEPEHLILDTPLHVMGEFEVTLGMPRSIPLPEGKVQWVLQVKIRGK